VTEIEGASAFLGTWCSNDFGSKFYLTIHPDGTFEEGQLGPIVDAFGEEMGEFAPWVGRFRFPAPNLAEGMAALHYLDEDEEPVEDHLVIVAGQLERLVGASYLRDPPRVVMSRAEPDETIRG